MDKLLMNRFSLPIVTGTPHVQESAGQAKPGGQQQPTVAFQDVLRRQMGGGLTFSKHAAARVEQRQVELTPSSIERLHEGVRLAEEKGLNDTLILVDSTAFIVNVRNNTVITTVNNADLRGNVFTNIDGTVII